jgi:hypothetical protein
LNNTAPSDDSKSLFFPLGNKKITRQAIQTERKFIILDLQDDSNVRQSRSYQQRVFALFLAELETKRLNQTETNIIERMSSDLTKRWVNGINLGRELYRYVIRNKYRLNRINFFEDF